MRLILATLAVAVAPAAWAQEHDHDKQPCEVMDVAALPPGIADWNGGAALATAAGADNAASLQLGKGYAATLKQKAHVAFAVEPEKPGGSVSYSGIFAFDVIEAGNYAVALSSAAWIDVVEGGKAVEPLSFGHGPACTTIRKIVVYPLTPGRHVL